MITINENLFDKELSFKEIDCFLKQYDLDDMEDFIYIHSTEKNGLTYSQNKNLHINLTRILRRLYDDEDFQFLNLDFSNGNDVRSMYYCGHLEELDIEDPFF